MRINHSIEINAAPGAIWEVLAAPDTYLHFMSGVTRWEVEGGQRSGLGARYRMLMRVGSAEVGGLIEIVEWEPERELAWSSVTGVDQRGRWRLRRSPDGRTRLELRFSYGVAGAGLPGWLAEKLAAPGISRNIRLSLGELKRRVEHEQVRRRARERPRSEAGAP